MTINLSDNNPRVSYSVAQGVTQSSFTVSFEFFDDDDLNVYVDGTLKTLTTDYTVTGGDGSTGTVTISVTGATGGSTVVITRDIDLERTTDFPSSGPFNIGSLNTELDRIIAITADLEDLAGRGVKLADFDTQAALTLPLASERGNKVLAFNAAGDTLVSQELGTFKGDWAASTAYVERDLVKDTTTNNVFIVTSAHTSSGSLPLTTNTNSAKYEKIIDITNPPGDVTFGGSITTSSSVTAGSFVIGSADINENDLEAIDEVIAGTVAASKAVVVDVNKDISSFRNLTATGDITFGSLSDGTITVTAFVDEDNMASDSATLVPTQQSVKAYVDAQVATADALSEILVNGNTTGGTNLVVSSGDTLDVNGALDVDGTIILDGNFPTGTSNVALGNTALDTAGATSLNNTAIGSAALTALTTGSDNTAVGNNALTALNTGYDNVAIGSNAGTSITEGVGNVAVGDIAAYYLTSGDANVAVGNGALRTATTPSNNVAIGGLALYLNETGSGNIALGSSSGYNLTTGSKNVIIGSYDGNEGGLDIRTSDNNLVLSDGDGNIRLYANSSGNVGIGTTSPSTKLDVNGTVTATGGAFTGDVTFGDNDKAIFGAGSDLEVYHDGSNSYIVDGGTGDLKIQGANVRLENPSGVRYFQGSSGNTYLYNSGNIKLATTSTGIDVTGTVTADGLTVDGTAADDVALNVTTAATNTVTSVLALNSQSSGVPAAGIGTGLSFKTETAAGNTETGATIEAVTTDVTALSEDFDVVVKTMAAGAAASERLRINSTGIDVTGTVVTDALRVETAQGNISITNSASSLNFARAGSNYIRATDSSGDFNFITGANDFATFRLKLASNGDISFYEDTGTTAKLFWDASAESLGIGTSSPEEALHVEKSSGAVAVKIESGNSDPRIIFTTTGQADYAIGIDRTDGKLHFTTGTGVGANQAMSINSSGNVGIGTTSPSGPFHVVDGRDELSFTNASNNVYLSLTAGYNTKNSIINFYNTSDAGYGRIDYDHATEYMAFSTNSAERMRINSSGWLLVGTTTGNLAYSTVNTGSAQYPDGSHANSRDGGIGGYYNRLTSDGDIVVFNKDGTTKGSISVTSSATAYNTSSDRRLKENIDDADDAGSLIDAIQVRKFDWKVDGSHQRYGMIAQELNDVAPEAVSIPEDEEEMQSVDYSKLVPMLIKEIQSLRSRLAELEAN